MKAIILFLLMCVSMMSRGEAIIIRGEPSPLEYRNDIYYLPPTYVIPPETTYLYVKINGINKVCFLNTSTAVLYDRISHINIFFNGAKTEWNCFPYITTIIEVRP